MLPSIGSSSGMGTSVGWAMLAVDLLSSSMLSSMARSMRESSEFSSWQVSSLHNSWLRHWWKTAFSAASFHPLTAVNVQKSNPYSAALCFPCLTDSSHSLTSFPSEAWLKTLLYGDTKCSYDEVDSPPLSHTVVTQVRAFPVSRLISCAILWQSLLSPCVIKYIYTAWETMA